MNQQDTVQPTLLGSSANRFAETVPHSYNLNDLGEYHRDQNVISNVVHQRMSELRADDAVYINFFHSVFLNTSSIYRTINNYLSSLMERASILKMGHISRLMQIPAQETAGRLNAMAPNTMTVDDPTSNLCDIDFSGFTSLKCDDVARALRDVSEVSQLVKCLFKSLTVISWIEDNRQGTGEPQHICTIRIRCDLIVLIVKCNMEDDRTFVKARQVMQDQLERKRAELQRAEQTARILTKQTAQAPPKQFVHSHQMQFQPYVRDSGTPMEQAPFMVYNQNLQPRAPKQQQTRKSSKPESEAQKKKRSTKKASPPPAVQPVQQYPQQPTAPMQTPEQQQPQIFDPTGVTGFSYDDFDSLFIDGFLDDPHNLAIQDNTTQPPVNQTQAQPEPVQPVVEAPRNTDADDDDDYEAVDIGVEDEPPAKRIKMSAPVQEEAQPKEDVFREERCNQVAVDAMTFAQHSLSGIFAEEAMEASPQQEYEAALNEAVCMLLDETSVTGVSQCILDVFTGMCFDTNVPVTALGNLVKREIDRNTGVMKCLVENTKNIAPSLRSKSLTPSSLSDLSPDQRCDLFNMLSIMTAFLSVHMQHLSKNVDTTGAYKDISDKEWTFIKKQLEDLATASE